MPRGSTVKRQRLHHALFLRIPLLCLSLNAIGALSSLSLFLRSSVISIRTFENLHSQQKCIRVFASVIFTCELFPLSSSAFQHIVEMPCVGFRSRFAPAFCRYYPVSLCAEDLGQLLQCTSSSGSRCGMPNNERVAQE